MKGIVIILTVIIVIGHCSSSESPLEKSAPWWEALRDKDIFQDCKSTCTHHSKGTRTIVELCDDTEICSKSRKSVNDLALEKCTEWSKKIPGILPGFGKREKHEPAKGTWLACAVFCKNVNEIWFTPRKELETLGMSAFLPDGVWCHRDGERDYYCQKNICLPGNYDFSVVRQAAYDENIDE